MNECMFSKLWVLVEWMNGCTYVWMKERRKTGNKETLHVQLRAQKQRELTHANVAWLNSSRDILVFFSWEWTKTVV